MKKTSYRKKELRYLRKLTNIQNQLSEIKELLLSEQNLSKIDSEEERQKREEQEKIENQTTLSVIEFSKKYGKRGTWQQVRRSKESMPYKQRNKKEIYYVVKDLEIWFDKNGYEYRGWGTLWNSGKRKLKEKVIDSLELEQRYKINRRAQGNLRQRRNHPLPYIKITGKRGYFYNIQKIEDWLEWEEREGRKSNEF